MLLGKQIPERALRACIWHIILDSCSMDSVKQAYSFVFELANAKWVLHGFLLCIPFTFHLPELWVSWTNSSRSFVLQFSLDSSSYFCSELCSLEQTAAADLFIHLHVLIPASSTLSYISASRLGSRLGREILSFWVSEFCSRKSLGPCYIAAALAIILL